jgi:hypothetical protein
VISISIFKSTAPIKLMTRMNKWLAAIIGLLCGKKPSEGIKLVQLAEPTKPTSMSLILPSKMNIHLQVTRLDFNEACTIGELVCLEEPLLKLVTLEPPYHPAPLKPRSIPAGTYDVTLYKSPHLGYKVPLLHDVDDFSEVEIHIGNYPRDTRGCLLVGLKQEGNSIGYSKSAFDLLMATLKDAERITLAII